jgi:hypothetical protein
MLLTAAPAALAESGSAAAQFADAAVACSSALKDGGLDASVFEDGGWTVVSSSSFIPAFSKPEGDVRIVLDITSNLCIASSFKFDEDEITPITAAARTALEDRLGQKAKVRSARNGGRTIIAGDQTFVINAHKRADETEIIVTSALVPR